jgi:hypothetical protein
LLIYNKSNLIKSPENGKNSRFQAVKVILVPKNIFLSLLPMTRNLSYETLFLEFGDAGGLCVGVYYHWPNQYTG